MNRAERRRREKAAQKLAQRKSFTPQEWGVAVEAAYQLGVEMTIKAARKTLGLGDVRIERILQQLKVEEAAEFHDYTPGGVQFGYRSENTILRG